MGTLAGAAAAEDVNPVARTVTSKMSASSVTPGTKVTVRGTVFSSPAPPADPIALPSQLLTLTFSAADGWHDHSTTRTDAKGAFTVTVPTWWLNNHQFRIRAEATPTHLLAYGPVQKLKVRPAVMPRGKTTSWKYISHGHRGRFNPCRTVTYRVNTKYATRGATADVQGAFLRISQATGQKFKYLGGTSRIAYYKGTFNTDTNIIIGWAKPSQVAGFKTGTAGQGGQQKLRWAHDHYGAMWEATRGEVALNSTLHFTPGFGMSKNKWSGTRGQILMHEIGHVMGLGHTSTRGELMFYRMQSLTARFGAGDLAGLSKLGMASGCVQKD